MPSVTIDIDAQIKETFDQNRISDLKRFMHKRSRLNAFNTFLMYAFHVVQSAGILITTIAAGNNDKTMVLIGSGINALASLIHVFEKNNTMIIKKLMNDIKLIREGNYVDEGVIDSSEESAPAKKEEAHAPAPAPPPPPPPPPAKNA